ncbi:MAG TPA: hypothetical protein VF146_00280 [Bryobacteraceae bacterium]
MPVSPDGTISLRTASAAPLLALTVQIDGQIAEIRDPGRAPGMVSGIIQVSVRVPDAVTGFALPGQLSAGDYPNANKLSIGVQ